MSVRISATASWGIRRIYMIDTWEIERNHDTMIRFGNCLSWRGMLKP